MNINSRYLILLERMINDLKIFRYPAHLFLASDETSLEILFGR